MGCGADFSNHGIDADVGFVKGLAGEGEDGLAVGVKTIKSS